MLQEQVLDLGSTEHGASAGRAGALTFMIVLRDCFLDFFWMWMWMWTSLLFGTAIVLNNSGGSPQVVFQMCSGCVLRCGSKRVRGWASEWGPLPTVLCHAAASSSGLSVSHVRLGILISPARAPSTSTSTYTYAYAYIYRAPSTYAYAYTNDPIHRSRPRSVSVSKSLLPGAVAGPAPSA